MSQNIYQLFDKAFVDQDNDQAYIDPFTFVWNDMNYWDIKEYYNALSIDSLTDIMDIYSSNVPFSSHRYHTICEFRDAIDESDDSSAWPMKSKEWTQDELDKLDKDAEASIMANMQVLEAKFDDKVKHISSVKKLYDVKSGNKEVDIDDEDIGLHVEI